MKTFILFSVITLVLFTACSEKKPLSPHETSTGQNISVRYGRPFKKGRIIFGGLEPFGKVYRCGADSATTVTFDKDVLFGGKPVKAGTYTLFVIPREQNWTIILNGQLGQWGAFDYDKYKSQDILQVEEPVTKLDNVVEQLTISLPPSAMIIDWDQTQVTIPVNFAQTDGSAIH
jgi:hypothetical protein